jgi:hypothetical protein
MGRKWSEPLEFVGFRRNYHANFGSSSGKSGLSVRLTGGGRAPDGTRAPLQWASFPTRSLRSGYRRPDHSTEPNPDRGLEDETPATRRGAVEPIETFVSTLCAVAPEAARLITHGDPQLPIAFDLDDSRLQAQFGPIPRTPLKDGIAETLRRFNALREQGRLDLADLG